MAQKAKMDIFYYNDIPDVNIPCEVLFESQGEPKNITYIDEDGSRQIYSLEEKVVGRYILRQRGGDGFAVMTVWENELFGTWSEGGYHGMWKIFW